MTHLAASLRVAYIFMCKSRAEKAIVSVVDSLPKAVSRGALCLN